MDNKPRPKTTRDSTWNDEQDKMTNPNRRQEEDEENVETPSRSGQRANNSDPGSSQGKPSDRHDELQGDKRQTDPSRRQHQGSEE